MEARYSNSGGNVKMEMHTEKDLTDLIRKGIDVYKIPVDDLYVCLARLVDVQEEYAKKEKARKEAENAAVG
jgi:hypothetical protein